MKKVVIKKAQSGVVFGKKGQAEESKYLTAKEKAAGKAGKKKAIHGTKLMKPNASGGPSVKKCRGGC